MSDAKPKPPEPIQVQLGHVCAKCVWWKQESGYEYKGGDCRKREPWIGLVMVSTDGYAEKAREGTWPNTKHDDFCGAFNSKEPEFISEKVKEAPVLAP